MKKLSVVITTKNGAETIGKVILRVLKAPPKDKEVIVVYGESKDGTDRIIERFKDKVKIVVDNISTGSAINTGILNSTGEIIVYIEDHAFISKDLFTKVLEVFEKHPDVGYVVLYRYNPKKEEFTKIQKLINFWRKNEGKTMGQFRGIRREAWREVGGFWIIPNSFDDAEYWTRLNNTKWKQLVIHAKCWDYPRKSLRAHLKKRMKTGAGAYCYFQTYKNTHPCSIKEFRSKTIRGMIFNILFKRFFFSPIYALKVAIMKRYLSYFPFYTLTHWSFAIGFLLGRYKWWKGEAKWDKRVKQLKSTKHVNKPRIT